MVDGDGEAVPNSDRLRVLMQRGSLSALADEVAYCSAVGQAERLTIPVDDVLQQPEEQNTNLHTSSIDESRL